MSVLRFTSKALAGLSVLALAGCGIWTDYDEIRGVKASPDHGTAFTRALTEEYAELALYEADQMYDWPDAAMYVRKTLASAEGVIEMPEHPDNWDLSPIAAHQAELLRARLVLAIDGNRRDTHPVLAARAQSRFDCWLEEAEEGWQDSRIKSCIEEFLTALTELEDIGRKPINTIAMRPAQLTSKPKPIAPVSAPVPAPKKVVVPLPPKRFNVSFAFDESMYRSGSVEIIKEAARAMAQLGAKRMTVEGHTDRAGPAAYNKTLSERRAEIVRAELVKLGVDRRLIAIEAMGETKPAVATKDGVAKAVNRRVEIVVNPEN